MGGCGQVGAGQLRKGDGQVKPGTVGKFATYDALAGSRNLHAEKLAVAMRAGQPEPGVHRATWPLPRGRVLNTWSETPSPVLRLPHARYDIEIAPGCVIVFRRFVGRIHGFDA